MKRIATIILFLSFAHMTVMAETRNFRLLKWNEMNSAIIKELNKSYVDSLPISKMERAGIDAMLAELDPYTIYIPQEQDEDLEMLLSKTYGGIGAIIYKPDIKGNVIINEPYENSPAHRSGLECGDEIMSINGKSTAGLDTKECSSRMKGVPGTKVRFKVKKVRTGKITDITVIRERIRIPDVQYYGMLDDTTGYVLLSGFTEGVSDEIREILTEMKSSTEIRRFVLDLRNNGGGLLSEAVGLASLFVPKGTVVVTAKGKTRAEAKEYRTAKDPVDTDMPVIVMVNSASASASEIVAGALQDLDRATIMGDRTFGKGLVQDIRQLPYGSQLKVTVAKYYIPSGRCVQAIDYSHRNEDGSVGAIPDSLTREFKTSRGRIVRDGGGITPDVRLPKKEYGEFTVNVVMRGLTEQYVPEYVRTHDSIPQTKDFHFDEYDSFIDFVLSSKDFSYKSDAVRKFEVLKQSLQKDGLYNKDVAERMDDIFSLINRDNRELLLKYRDELLPYLEEEIVVRYRFQKAGIEIKLRYDEELRCALTSPLI